MILIAARHPKDKRRPKKEKRPLRLAQLCIDNLRAMRHAYMHTCARETI
jgi:hypothetical protein